MFSTMPHHPKCPARMMERRRCQLKTSDVWIEMPQEYSAHPWSQQLMTLKDEEMLKDVVVVFGASGRVERMSGFLLSLLSPVWRARLCGEFSQGRDRQLELEEDEAEALQKAIELGCGGRGGMVMEKGLEELFEVGRFAERYQMDDLRMAIEEEAIRHLTLETCSALLMLCETSGLLRIEAACRNLALERFEELTTTEGFMGIGEDVLRSLVEDDRLECEMEEKVFEGVVRWMEGSGRGEMRGENLLESIRFPLMSRDYLMTSARKVLTGSARLEQLVTEALRLKSVWAGGHECNGMYSGCKAKRERVCRGVRWEDAKGCGEAPTLLESQELVLSLADGGRWVFGGLCRGEISVRNKATLEVERTLTGHTDDVWALAVWKGWLVSGSDDGDIRVWDVGGGRCVRTILGHSGPVRVLAVGENMLSSSSEDGPITVWRLDGPPSTWRCEHSLVGYSGTVCALTWWRSKVVSGGDSGVIRVWDTSTGESVRALRGHNDRIQALVVTESRLISSSMDQSVREWCLDCGVCVRVVEAFPPESPLAYIANLAISGRMLVGASCNAQRREVFVVWSLETWAEKQRLEQPDDDYVQALLAMDGELWSTLGTHTVVWGRKG